MASKAQTSHDTLRYRLAIDVASATVAATLVTPVVAIMDRIVVERSCTSTPSLKSFKKHLVKALSEPGRFAVARTTLLVFGLYLGTFTTANTTSSICDSRFLKFDSTTSKTATTMATLAANVPLGIYKDTVYSKLFGCAALAPGNHDLITMAPRTPLPTYFAFLLRDAVTIYTSFVLPDIVSFYVPENALSNQFKAVTVQLVVPALGQVSNTPIHLVGLEIYNKQGHAKFSDVFSLLQRDLVTASVTRMCRIIPAFGFGTLTNNELRQFLNHRLNLTH